MDLAKGISKDPEKRRSELIEAAERIFAAKGYEETSVSDIVKEINVAQGTSATTSAPMTRSWKR
jgi:AcrR family transcriptional regulator